MSESPTRLGRPERGYPEFWLGRPGTPDSRVPSAVLVWWVKNDEKEEVRRRERILGKGKEVVFGVSGSE